jgi:hypothetical protein
MIEFHDPVACALAFRSGMSAWVKSLKRPDLTEADRVAGALDAYQKQLDACMIIKTRYTMARLQGTEPRGCPTPGACSCPQPAELEARDE